MSDFVRPCCWFCIQKCSPPQQDQDFRWVSAIYVGSIGGSSAAILRVCWHCWGHLGMTFGHLVAFEDALCARFGGYSSRIVKNNPELYLRNALPRGPRGAKIITKNRSKTKISSKNAYPHGREGATQPKIN